MLYRRLIIALCATSTVLFPLLAHCDPAAVDLADTLDFENFHASDDWSIGIGQEGMVAKRTQAAEEVPASSPHSLPADKPAVTSNSQIARNDTPVHRISNPYSQRPGTNRQSPVDATENLFRSMAETCPQGWQKDREWTTPIAEGFLLHFEFHCLESPS